jgi:hypothetical protein
MPVQFELCGLQPGPQSCLAGFHPAELEGTLSVPQGHYGQQRETLRVEHELKVRYYSEEKSELVNLY